MWRAQVTTTGFFASASVADVVYLAKNDTLNLYVTNERGSTALFADGNFNYLSIAKVSN